MARKTTPEKLAKFLRYILETRPDEFGLVPGPEGWYRCKDLMKIFGEEAGWKHIRQQDLNEVRLTLRNPPFILEAESIRGRNPAPPVIPVSPESLPKLLFTCIRRRAYPHVSREGISPQFHPSVILSTDRDMALRIGKRTDHDPIVLTIHAPKAARKGLAFHRFGENLFLSDPIPPECFSGPPLPKETEEPSARPRDNGLRQAERTPGSFFIDPAKLSAAPAKPSRKGGKKEIPWKKERKRIKRKKGGPKPY